MNDAIAASFILGGSPPGAQFACGSMVPLYLLCAMFCAERGTWHTKEARCRSAEGLKPPPRKPCQQQVLEKNAGDQPWNLLRAPLVG
jgi:hypothetical protein